MSGGPKLRVFPLLWVLALVAGCGGDRLGSLAEGGSGGGGAGGSLGVGGSGGPPPPPPFKEPTACECIPRSGPNRSTKHYFQAIPSPEANCGRWFGSYWITGEEPIVIDTILGLGSKFSGSHTDVSLVFLVDGRVVPARYDGETALSYVTQLRQGDLEELRLRVEVPTVDIPTGAHTGALLAMIRAVDPVHSDRNRPLGLPLTHGWSFALMVNGTEFPDVQEQPLVQLPAPDYRTVEFEDAVTGERLPYVIPWSSTPRRLRLRFAPLMGAVAAESRMALLAFRGDEQVQLGSNPSPYVYRGHADHVATLEWDQASPTEPGLHPLRLILQSAFLQPTEDAACGPLEDVPHERQVLELVLEGPPAP